MSISAISEKIDLIMKKKIHTVYGKGYCLENKYENFKTINKI